MTIVELCRKLRLFYNRAKQFPCGTLYGNINYLEWIAFLQSWNDYTELCEELELINRIYGAIVYETIKSCVVSNISELEFAYWMSCGIKAYNDYIEYQLNIYLELFNRCIGIETLGLENVS